MPLSEWLLSRSVWSVDKAMEDNEKPIRHQPERQYPPFYERFVPIAMGIIAAIIIVLLLIIFSVALGLFPGTG